MVSPQAEKRSRDTAGNSSRPDTRKVILMQPHDTFDPSSSKTCTKCGQTKPLADFYLIHTGQRAGHYHAECRQCNSLRHAQYRAAHIEECRATDRLYYRQNSEEHKKRSRQWAVRNKSVRRQITNRYKIRHFNEQLARGAVNDAVRRGKFPPARTMVCEGCKEAQAAHWHHHKGYAASVRLDVIALCMDCHAKEHYYG